MGTNWQRFKAAIPKGYTPAEREVIADEIIDFIRNRVQSKHLDKSNKPLPKYSDAYAKSLNFKIAGKSKGEVNLTQSGDMLGAMTLLGHKRGEVVIGFEKGSKENAVADGNIRGTYGKSKPVAPRRDFLGLTKADLAKILKKLPPGSEKLEAATKAYSEARQTDAEVDTEENE